MQFLNCKITLSFSNQKIKDRSETLINKGKYEVKIKFIVSLIVKDVDEWLKGSHWIPKTEKIMSILKESKSTKDLYPFFGWETTMKKDREFLDKHVHASSYRSILTNCQDIRNTNRERQLMNAYYLLKRIMVLHLHLSFI